MADESPKGLKEIDSLLNEISLSNKNSQFKENVGNLFEKMNQMHSDIISENKKRVLSSVEYIQNEFGILDKSKKLSPSEVVIHDNLVLRNELNTILSEISTYKKEVENLDFKMEIVRLKSDLKNLSEDKKQLTEYNENINRRLKLLMKSDVVWNEEIDEEIQVGCICGGKVFDILNFQSLRPIKQISEMQEEKEKEQEEPEKIIQEKNENPEKDFYSAQEKLEKLENDAKELHEAIVKLQQDKKKLKNKLEFADERFYESKLFANLLGQGHDLIKYIINLRSRLIQNTNALDDIEKFRLAEIGEVITKNSENQEQLLSLIKDVAISYDEERKKLETIENELIKNYNLSNNFDNMMNLIKGHDQREANLNKENAQLRLQIKELMSQKLKHETEIKALNDQLFPLNAQLQKIKIKYPEEMNFEEVSFRHSKHKEFLNDLLNINKQHELGIKEKVEDLKVYIKTREEKIESLEAKLKKSTDDLERQKKQFEELINEVELNSQIADDTNKKCQQFQNQVVSLNENFASLVKDKVAERATLENEKNSLQIKLKADVDLIDRLDGQIKELNKKIEILTETKSQETEEEMILNQKICIEEYKMAREALLRKFEDQKVEINTLKELTESLQKNINNYIKDNEKLHNKSKDKQNFISQKLQRAKNITKDIELDEDDIELMKLENQKYRNMLLCSVCGLKDKAVVLSKCFHTFCKECIDKTMEVRNRRCPKCKTKIGNEDIKSIWWD